MNILKWAFLAALFWGAVALIWGAYLTPAHAAQCGPRDGILALLAERYSESRRSIGLAANGAVVETFASAAGSWTITYTSAEGVMCLLYSGTAYEATAEALPPKGAPG